MILVQVSKISQVEIGRPHVVANRKSRYQLDKIREELDIPWKELNKLASNVVGREFGDCSRLSETENRRFRIWLRKNQRELGERYRKLKWGGI
jgi:hypothetical protein